MRATRSALALITTCVTCSCAVADGLCFFPIEGFVEGVSPGMDFVYDSTRETLFISTPQGAVDRIHLPTLQRLDRWWIGRWTPALDLTPDGSALLVCELQSQVPTLYRVNPDTGESIALLLRGQFSGRPWDIVALTNERALFSTYGNNPTVESPLRDLNLDTLEIQARVDAPIAVEHKCKLHASQDRSKVFVHNDQPPNECTIFDSTTDSFLSSSSRYIYGHIDPTSQYLVAQWFPSSGSRETRVLDLDFNVLSTLHEGNVLAHAFSPDGNTIHYADRITRELATVSVPDWTETERWDTRFSFDGALRIEMSPDGRWIFVAAEDGVLVVDREADDWCYADFNCDGSVNTLDVLTYLGRWASDRDSADCDYDGQVRTSDVLCFLNLWNAGCP